MTQILIFGAGKVADVLYHHISSSGEHSVAAFACDAPFMPETRTFRDLPVVNIEQATVQFPPKTHSMIVAVGYHELNSLRRRMYDKAKQIGYRLISYVSPRASVGTWLEAGDNCIILDDAVLEPGVRIGNNVTIWSGALIGHHSVVEDDAWVAGHAVLGGSVKLGSGSFVGLGAIVGHEVELGAKSFLGAGTLVTKCAPPKSVFIGKSTELFRLDSERFLKLSKLR